MAIFNSVTELTNSIKDWLNRPDLSDLLIGDFLTLANGEMQRKLNTRNQMSVETRTNFSVTEVAEQRFYYPPGADGIVSISDSKGRKLNPVTFSEYKLLAENSSGEACAFAGVSNYIYIAPAISENDSFTIIYKDEDASYNTNYQGSTVVAAYNPLLLGSLMYAYMYLKDDNRVALYREKFDDAIQDLNKQSTKTLGLGRIKDDSIAQYGGPLV
tara:strand:- start:741 stop:1382 length:642 start_codon:yes stop_codon:yes gene_type:complete